MYISIDIGKSNTRVASTPDLIKIHRIVKFSTNQDLEIEKKLIAEAIHAVRDNQDIEAVVLGVTGMIDKIGKKFVRSPNFPALDGLDFNTLMPEILKHILLYVENDAALGALGEAYYGLGKDKKVVAYLTLSSGVGGSLVIKDPKGYDLINAEPGHHIICETDTLTDKTGISGTLESYCSGHMFEERYGSKPEKNADEKVWKQYAKHLSTGILNIIALWNPDIIILGGGVSIHNFETFFPYLMEELTKQTFFNIPEIEKALLGDETGIYGGFILIKENL
jgi:glucokinase